MKLSTKITSVFPTVSKVNRGIRYGYKGDKAGLPLYLLKNRPVSPFINNIYNDLKKLEAGQFVLDLGCGDGRFLKYAPKDRKWFFLGIDYDQPAILAAENYLGKQDLVMVGDITKLASMNLPERKLLIGAVLSHRVLHGLSTNEQYGFLSSVAQLLSSGKSLYITLASAEDDWKALALKEQGAYKQDTLNECSYVMFTQFGIERNSPFLVNFATKQGFSDLAVATGFKIAEHSTIFEPSGYEHLKKKQNAYHAFKLTRI